MLLLVPAALAEPFVGGAVHGWTPLTEEYAVAGPLVGAYAGTTFPRMGFEVRAGWGPGEGDFRYDLVSARIDGLHLFVPDAKVRPLLLYGVGLRGTTTRTSPDRSDARRAGVYLNPAVVGFVEAGAGVVVKVAGPLHARLDTRAWVGIGSLGSGDRGFAGLDASLGLELRPRGPADRDKDGLLDQDDTCPDAPEDFDRLLDRDGCPEDDVDGDTIVDASDKCPTRAETFNKHRDTDGCPDVVPPVAVVPVPEPLRKFTGTIDGIVFALDSAEILPASEPVLGAAAAVLRDYPEVRVVIRGHTDATADDAYNLALSKARAEAVAAWLVSRGVEAARLRAEGLGETEPVDTNDTEEGRAQNRRVEFVILAK